MLIREREQNLNSLLDSSFTFFTLSAPLVFHNLLFLDHLQSIRQHNVICEVFARYQVNSLVHTFPHMQASKQPGGTRGMRVINIQSSVSLLFHLKWRAKQQCRRRKSMSFCSKKKSSILALIVKNKEMRRARKEYGKDRTVAIYCGMYRPGYPIIYDILLNKILGREGSGRLICLPYYPSSSPLKYSTLRSPSWVRLEGCLQLFHLSKDSN